MEIKYSKRTQIKNTNDLNRVIVDVERNFVRARILLQFVKNWRNLTERRLERYWLTFFVRGDSFLPKNILHTLENRVLNFILPYFPPQRQYTVEGEKLNRINCSI